MADVLISRQDYNAEAEGTQMNGWKPLVSSGAITGTTVGTSGATIPADFKDHKTVFIAVNSGSSDATLTLKAGNKDQAYADVVLTIESGTNVFWLDSAPFVDKFTGTIEVVASANITLFGYEMR